MKHTLRHAFATPPTILCVAALCLAVVSAVPSNGQDDAAYSSWSQLEESRATREYRESLRETAAFDEDARRFLETIALPQLSRPSNRATIERTRRRIREVLLDSIQDDKALDKANRTALRFLENLVWNEGAEPIVRLNAAIFIGELQDGARRPWEEAAWTLAAMAGPQAAKTLAAMAGPEVAGPLNNLANRPTLPPALRIAALAGLADHVDKSGGGDSSRQLAAIVEPAIAAIVAEAAAAPPGQGPRGTEDDWLAARAATILAAVKGPVSKETAARLSKLVPELSKLVQDAGRRLDVRIRAARALGAVAVIASSPIDAATAIASIRALAVEGLQGDLATVDRLRLEQQHSGLSAGGQPGQAQASVLACRRAAWRLDALADALLTDGDEARGLAVLAGDGRKAAETLAADLRQSARALDENPDEQSLEAAFAAIAPEAAAGRAAGTKPPAARPAPAEPKPAEPPASPFEPNPFGN